MEQKSYQQMRKEFQETFFKEISPKLMMYEKDRKNQLLLARIVAGIFLLIGVYFLIITLANIKNSYIAGQNLQTVFLMCILASINWRFIKKNFEDSIKEKCMSIVCKCFGDLEWISSEYFRNNGESNIFLDSNLLSRYDSATYDDIFEGSRKDVKFEIIESRFTLGCGKQRKAIFDGVIVKLKMNKNFSGNTVIKPDTIGHFSPSRNLRHTTLEDVQFEKQFDVFTNDEVEARYLITPSFMERLKKMKTAFFASEICCAFYNEYLLIGLSTTKDLFSICSLTKPVNDPKQFFTMYEEIVSIIKLIDHFKLDRKIGL